MTITTAQRSQSHLDWARRAFEQRDMPGCRFHLAQALRLNPGDLDARLLETELANVSVKAKTMEGLGPIGEGRAIAAHAVVTIEPLR